MSSPQINRLIEIHQLPVVTAVTHDNYIQTKEHLVLFFPGDPKRHPESDDVAMVLPEILKAFANRLEGAIVALDSEPQLQRHYAFTAWPALVFLKRGRYLGVITHIQNWEDYLQQIEQMLQRDPTPPPISVVQVNQ